MRAMRASSRSCLRAGSGRSTAARFTTGVRSAPQVKHKREGIVDGALLLPGEAARELFKSFEVNGAQLLDEHACGLAGELDLGPECGARGPAGRRLDDRGREPEQRSSACPVTA